MLVSEFIDRTGYEPTAEEYADIEEAYYFFKGDKDAYCKAWAKANPHKAGTLWARTKEQERWNKVFGRVTEFVRKSKRRREEFYGIDYDEREAFMDDMCARCKCRDREELSVMVDHLTKAVGVWQYWKPTSKDLLWTIKHMA